MSKVVGSVAFQALVLQLILITSGTDSSDSEMHGFYLAPYSSKCNGYAESYDGFMFFCDVLPDKRLSVQTNALECRTLATQLQL